MTNEEAIEMMEREKKIACFNCMYPQAVGYCEEVCRLPEAFDMAIEALETVFERKGTFEWCTDCKEYDQEQHCCHRWTKQIRKTIAEWESENGIVRCGHCEWWKCNPNTEEYGVCKKVSYDDFEVVMHSDDFCSYGKRREDERREP